MTEPVPIRHAATVVVLRDRFTAPRILMGQRGAKAVFMPNKFVFPGGAVDTADTHITLAKDLPRLCTARLTEDPTPGIDPVTPNALAAAAIRELFEETGQSLATAGSWPAPPPEDWKSFAAHGLPNAAPLQFIFRALTPPGRPRRFDARFFLVDAAELNSDPDDFSNASDELSHLQWIPLKEARAFDMPFITEVVLAEVQARLTDLDPPNSVPYFKNNDEANLFLRLNGQPQSEG